jgi:UDP-N-acetylglucosamine--N-acetylmuramyl-(pentapeptide) pyrophosphoryl-undecaprenol N-acetylglucosamine transferase
VIAALPLLKELQARMRITHQTGDADFDRVSAAYREAGWEKANVTKYVENMVNEYANVDLVICRAGATTTAELIAAGKASVMIPFPLAADDHQRRNAEALQAAGGTRMILQADLSGERLAAEIKNLAGQPELITTMEQSSRNLARGDAAAAVVDLIEKLVKK